MENDIVFRLLSGLIFMCVGIVFLVFHRKLLAWSMRVQSHVADNKFFRRWNTIIYFVVGISFTVFGGVVFVKHLGQLF